MKKSIYAIGIAALTLLNSSCRERSNNSSNPAAIPTDKKIEELIEAKLKQMSLVEKVGQMTQLTLDVVGEGSSVYSSNIPFKFDHALVDTVLRKYKVGSILNTPTNTPLTNQEWTEIITHLQKVAIEETGIPLIYGVDQIHGTTYTIGGTLFPQAIGMGATFNRELVSEGARITAYETKAGNIPWNFSPVLDLGRDPRWSRMWETYGEDTYLVSEMGEACVIGYQGDSPNQIGNNQVAACLKHFMGYGVPFSGKDRTPSYISEQDMRERHFEPFVRAIRAGALSVMVNSAMNNGMPLHADRELLTGWLKEDLNWDGVIVTDWADINNLFTRDKVASSKKEAIKMCINAGIDMSMVPYEWSFAHYLKELVEEGDVPMSRIDDAVRRILRMKHRLNLFERPYWSSEEYPEFASPNFAKAALQAAEESMVLLKNENNLLPLQKGKRILVTGPNANSMRTLNGGWTLSWQGEKADLYGADYNTILEAIESKVGKANVVYEPGVTYKTDNPPTTNIAYWEENAPEIEKVVAASRNVDVIVLCVGETSYCETPGNLESLELSPNQQNLAKALAKTGKPVVLVLNQGRPRIIAAFEPQMSAVVNTFLPGNYGGDALANLLFGDSNPSGKMPYTYPKSANSLITYDYKPCENLDKMEGAYDYDAVLSVQYAFGYGLSYTTFNYDNLKVDRNSFKRGETLTFSVDVTNSGSLKGKESILLFVSDKVASLTPDVRRLRAFKKVELNAGETKTVELTINTDELAFVGYNARWILEKGEFGIQVGTQTLDINCTETYQWPSRIR